ncbi:MAG: hypothetical protein RLZZ458_3046 [Planctomycetota bacterium]
MPAETPAVPPASPHFQSLADSRKAWIQTVLRQWCHTATVQDLRRAELEWFDLAGRADAAATLWTWAWERFPDAVHADFPGLNETWPLEVALTSGEVIRGYPDARRSLRGQLVLVSHESAGPGGLTESAPVSLDHIRSIRRVP